MLESERTWREEGRESREGWGEIDILLSCRLHLSTQMQGRTKAEQGLRPPRAFQPKIKFQLAFDIAFFFFFLANIFSLGLRPLPERSEA